MGKVVFIDRDGVINKDLWKYVEHWGEFEFLPGVLDALRTLTQAGFAIVIISNQAGVGDGVFTETALNEVNREMLKAIEAYGAKISGTYYCLHAKIANCNCRKPKTGLFENAMRSLPAFDKRKTFFIGDKLSDIKAGIAFGLRTIMTLSGYGEREQTLIADDCRPDYIVKDLSEAVEIVVNSTR